MNDAALPSGRDDARATHNETATPDGPAMRRRFDAVRAHSKTLLSGLSAEDLCVQAMPDASPGKWHLAHTSWFFETMLLKPMLGGYGIFNERFHHLFNSYYDGLGACYPRPLRGLLTRPSLEEVWCYRAHVDTAMRTLLERASPDVLSLTEVGLAHEEQHQELMLTDALYLLSCNPLQPALRPPPRPAREPASAVRWQAHPGGMGRIGHQSQGFAFDNELPAHDVWLQPFEMASRPVSNAEYLAFIEDGGYRRADLWLSDGWHLVRSEGWQAPLYWRQEDGAWLTYTLHGCHPMDPHAPACHLSFHEAVAYANWVGARLPTEAEWECWARAAGAGHGVGEVWEWTRSAYEPYPRYRPWDGPLGEYNGKFMVGQYVLRGASVATPPASVRLSYRNFFPPSARWQFSGLRLARDI